VILLRDVSMAPRQRVAVLHVILQVVTKAERRVFPGKNAGAAAAKIPLPFSDEEPA
jgi:hypothetical protein